MTSTGIRARLRDLLVGRRSRWCDQCHRWTERMTSQEFEAHTANRHDGLADDGI